MPELHKWGQPPWRVEYDCPVAALPAETAVAVVGAGLTGLSAAYHLRRARPDWPVTVLEADAAGAGASARSGGIILEDTAAGPAPGFEHCLNELAALVERERMDCGLVVNGCWELSHTTSMAESFIRWDDERTPLRISGLVRGGAVDSGRLVAGLARAAMRAGASIHERCPVTAWDFADPGVVRLETGQGRLAARWVLLATNAYALGMDELRSEALPMLTTAVATAPLRAEVVREIGLEPRLPFYTEDVPYLWGRLTDDDALLVGSGLVAPEAGDVAQLSISAPAAQLLFASLERRIRGFHPALRGVSFTHRWAGPIAITRDRRPVLRPHSRSPRVLLAGGYSGHGVAQSLRMGQLVRDRFIATETQSHRE